jgi:hypothetical protein
MSFGLGYWEDGVWVDHSIPSASGPHEPVDGSAIPAREEAMDAVHQWFTCCTDTVGDMPETTHPNIAIVVPEIPSGAWEAPRARSRASQR